MGLILRSIVTCLIVSYALGLDFNFPEKKPCIMAQTNVQFKLSYKNETIILSDPLVNTDRSQCAMDKNIATLVLYWKDKNDTMTFTFMRGAKKVEMGVTYEFTPLDHFKDSDDSHLTVMVSPQKELSMSNMSFKCDSSLDISFNKSMYELVMTVAKLQVQAFGVENGTFSASEDCSEDTLTTETKGPETTTHHALTTTGPSPTTEPSQYMFRYPSGGEACILLNAAIQLDINYMDTKNNTRTAEVNIPDPGFKAVRVYGQCGNESTSITLSWLVRHSTFSIRMNFSTTEEENKEAARLKTIEVTAELYKEEYPELDNNSTMVMSEKNVDLFSSSKTTYYICRSRQEEKLDNTTTVVIYKIQVQAFGVKKSKFTGSGTDCSEDHTTEIPTTTRETTNATTLPTNATTLPTNATTLPTNATTLPTNATTLPTNGTTLPTNATTLPTNATTPTTNATTSATTTSAPPGPHPTNTYSVRKGNVTCVYFKAGMDFTFPYMKNGTNASALVSVPANATADGTCDTQNETTNEMNINFYNWKLTFVFGPDNSSSQLGDSKFATYSVKSITLHYQMDPALFPGYVGNDTDEHNATASFTGPLFQSKVNGSYKCNVDTEVSFSGNIKLETYSLQYKAFNKDNSTDFDGVLTECSGDNSNDNKTNSVVPIAVGAALAGLVVIVLIAYLIGRRRNRKGYESV